MTERETRIEVLATPHELLRAATGHPTVVGTADGQEVRLRIPTAEEYREAVQRGRQWHADNGLTAPDPPSDEQIARVIRPLDSS